MEELKIRTYLTTNVTLDLHPEIVIYGSFRCNTLRLNDPRYILRYSVYSLVFKIACAYSTVARKLLLDDVVIIQLLSLLD